MDTRGWYPSIAESGRIGDEVGACMSADQKDKPAWLFVGTASKQRFALYASVYGYDDGRRDARHRACMISRKDCMAEMRRLARSGVP